MCNLYRMAKSQDEVADFFRAIVGELTVAPAGNAPEEVYPGYPGLVMDGAALRQMTWGFPLRRTGAKGQPLKPKPVNNARADKLSSPFWSASFRARRCLIPVSAFAEAEGPRGGKTRTWFTLPPRDVPGTNLMAIGGLWRDTAEWGAAYSMIMTDACPEVSSVHDRMPVILAPEHWASWISGSPEEAHALCRPWSGGLEVARTDQPWAARR